MKSNKFMSSSEVENLYNIYIMETKSWSSVLPPPTFKTWLENRENNYDRKLNDK